jgi:hypothetical protein
MVKTQTLKLSDIDNLDKLTEKECIHQILSLRSGIAENARLSAIQAQNDWHSVAPLNTGASNLQNAVMMDMTYKYTYGLFFDTGKHAIQSHTLNLRGAGHGKGSKWAGFESKFLQDEGRDFFGRDITSIFK